MIVILLVMMSVICVLVMDILAVDLAQTCIISTKGLDLVVGIDGGGGGGGGG